MYKGKNNKGDSFMNRYVNRECPYCHRIIRADDNIVVCSKCGIAHHVECWNENHGCTTYGCDGDPRAALNLGFNTSEILTQAVEYSKAPLWPRLWASILDSIIAGAAFMVGIIILIVAGVFDSYTYNGYYSDYTPYNGVSYGWYIFGILLIVGGIIWALTYNFIKDGIGKGQSYGKRAAGLMVVDLKDNTPCSKGKSALRNLIWTALNMIPYIGWLIEPIVVLANDKGRRLGDLAANTQVITVKEYEKLTNSDQWKTL